MFSHIFITRLKCLVRDRQLVFWTLLFPLILAVFFQMAFANLNSEEMFHPIGIAVVDSSAYRQNEAFHSALKAASSGKDRIFDLTEASESSAKQLLNEGKIEGYISVGDKIGLTVGKSGLNQTIVQSFLNEYGRTASAAEYLIRKNPSAAQSLSSGIGDRREYTKDAPVGGAAPDNTYSYFYALIAMACLYGGFWGLKEITDVQADLSDRAVRINTAPVHKLKVFLSGMCAALVINFLEILALLAFLAFGLKVDFGPRAGLVVLTAFTGCLVGFSSGAFVGAAVRKGEGLKVAVLISYSMAGSFLAGMMYQNMKYIVAKNAPAVAWLNPVNLLTDAFYSLYYYGTLTRYALNMAALAAFTVAFCAAVYLIIRRQKYASL